MDHQDEHVKDNQDDYLKKEGGLTADQLFEEVQREAGIQAIERVAESQLNDVINVREHFPVDDLDLLTTHITNIKDIPSNVRDRMGSFHKRIRVIIEKVAAQIEERRYKATEASIGEMKLSVNEKARALSLIKAEKELQTSYGSLKTTVDVLTRMNDMILHRIEAAERSGDRTTERNLFLANSILVYELTDYVIQYVEDFQIKGVDEIMRIQRSELKKLSDIQKNQADLKRRAKYASSFDFQETTLASIGALEESIALIRQEWEGYTDEVREMKGRIGPITTRLYDLKILRDLAGMQIQVFEAAAAVGILQRNILALQDAMKGLEKLKLASLTPERVRRLFFLGNEGMLDNPYLPEE